MSREEAPQDEISEEIETLIQDYLDESIDEEGAVTLQAALRNSRSVRDRFREATTTAALLREEANRHRARKEENTRPQTPASSSLLWFPLGLSAFVFLLGLYFFAFPPQPRVAAQVVNVSEASWLSSPWKAGEKIRIGSQLQLSSGEVEIAFASGAVSRLQGPVLFEVESKNGALLHYGKAYSIAEGESSKGFTIRTASGTYIDQGTAFITEATADGYSQMLVLEGAVDADSSGFGSQRIERGSGIGFDPGSNPIMIQIEQGSQTRAFEFPNIPPPSGDDFASTHPVALEAYSRKGLPNQSVLAPPSGPLDVLLNGRVQRNHDDPSQSLFFRNDTVGYLLFDLGSSVPVASIHTYSWHRNKEDPESTLRAVQRFTLWGARDERPPRLPDSIKSGGWERIARVDTDVFFRVSERTDRPGQQACRLLPRDELIGEFRYLLFEVLPTIDVGADSPRHTFFSEIDIFSGK